MNEQQQMVIKNEEFKTIEDNPRYNKFALPQSEMSRQRDGLNPISSTTSSRQDEGQRSFRIRKYSRSLSRSSRTSLHSARDNEEEQQSPDTQLKTIEIDNIRPTVDIKP